MVNIIVINVHVYTHKAAQQMRVSYHPSERSPLLKEPSPLLCKSLAQLTSLSLSNCLAGLLFFFRKTCVGLLSRLCCGLSILSSVLSQLLYANCYKAPSYLTFLYVVSSIDCNLGLNLVYLLKLMKLLTCHPIMFYF